MRFHKMLILSSVRLRSVHFTLAQLYNLITQRDFFLSPDIFSVNFHIFS